VLEENAVSSSIDDVDDVRDDEEDTGITFGEW
jgi:hypothetical protein